ncbi:hypothetical protein H0H93_006743 [Arthromyces matolae]|nr:hypothetical protein H0H93_006743 [Arthromyces matolae]
MLAASVNETPRPRPPAKIRRSSALAPAPSPPPSYAAAFTLTPDGKSRVDSLLGSPMAATYHLQQVGWDNQSQVPNELEEDQDLLWVNERSREELSELLVKADDLIKERENGYSGLIGLLHEELGIASAVCKTLYDDNVMLKSKHQQLLSRLPSSSPSPSPEPLPQMSRYSISLNRPISEYDSSPVSTTAYKNVRKISVSTADISHLADQNAELLDKLQRMESESISADHAGRRVLKRLEKEIQTLRQELEKTQAKSEELEKKANEGWQSQQEALRKKEERELKLRAIRNLTVASDDGDDEQEIRDFAPENMFGASGPSRSLYPPGETPRRFSGTPLRRPPHAPAPFTPHPESALISQLLEKIQELEETNGRIIEQQSETKEQLNAVQRETEHINRVYECLADANRIDLAAEASSDGGIERASYDETVRFKSFARNLAAEFVPSPSANVRHQLNLTTGSRTRKSVVGLFDVHGEEQRTRSIPDQLKSFDIPVPFASPDMYHKSLSIDTSGLPSPAISSQGSLQNSQPTLQSELGHDFQDGWGLSASDHRRSNSLYNLSPISAPSSPSPSSANHSIDLSRNIGSPYEQRNGLPTPVSMMASPSALRLSVEPPTPDKVTLGASKSQAEVSSHSLRYQRMSETLRSRTNRWVDGRFKDTLTGNTKFEFPSTNVQNEKGVETQETSRPSTPLPERLANAFEAAVENITGQPASNSDNGSSQEVARTSASQVQKMRGFGAVMLEIWLWLQFGLIILVFLWAMARRGPKAVLGDTAPGHRRSHSSRVVEAQPSRARKLPVLSHADRRKQRKAEKRKANDEEEDISDKTTKKKRKVENGKPVSVPAGQRKNSIWVGNMSFKTTQEDLKEFFKDVGEVVRIFMPTKPGANPAMKPENRGFAYVDFATEDAKTAAIARSEKPLIGRKLLIKDGDDFTGRPTKPGAELASTSAVTHSKTARKILSVQKQAPAPTLFVGNLGFETTEQDIRQLLEAHRSKPKDVAAKDEEHEGDNKTKDVWLRKIRMGTFEDSGLCKGFAFIDFTSIEHATASLVNPKNHQLNGRKLVVEYAGADAVRRGAPKVKREDGSAPPPRKFKSDGPAPHKRIDRSEKRPRRDELPVDEGNEEQGEKAGEKASDDEIKAERRREGRDGFPEFEKRQKGPRSRPKPGAALAQAKRESAAILPSKGNKITF